MAYRIVTFIDEDEDDVVKKQLKFHILPFLHSNILIYKYMIWIIAQSQLLHNFTIMSQNTNKAICYYLQIFFISSIQFKAAIINIFILTMDQMIQCHVKGVKLKTKKDYLTVVPLSSMCC